MPWGVAAAAATAAISSALAPNPNIPGATATRGPPSFLINTPGFNETQNSPFSYGFTPSAGNTQALSDFAAAQNQAAGGVDDLINQVGAGNAIGRARDDALASAYQKTSSDLQGNLASRRMLGSSFGQNSLAQVGLQYGNDLAASDAQSKQDQITQLNSLYQERANLKGSIAQAELNQNNIDSAAAINLVNGTQQTFQDNAAVIGQLAAANAAGTGAFLQKTAAPAINTAGNNLLSLLTGSSGGGGIGGAGGSGLTSAQLTSLSAQAGNNVAAGAAGL